MKENSREETIKIIEREIKEAEHYTDITGLCLTLNKELCNAFINILSDYKRVLKENEELEEINNELEAEKNEAIRRYNFEIIPIKKVKDKIEYLDNQQKQWIEDRELKESDREIIFARDILQELIEGKK